MAHRGGAGLAPENTLEAFRQAVDVWRADVLEMDVRATADGHIVVIHDDTVDRTTDGTGAVSSFTLEELRKLDAGHRFTDPAGRHSFRGQGVRIPLFEDVITSLPDTRLNVETKEKRATRGLLDIIRRHGAQHRVLFAASHEPDRAEARGYEGPWGASAQQIRRFYILHRVPFGGLYTPPVDALQVPDVWEGRRVVTPRFVREAHARNIAVHVWTIDEVDDMRRLYEWGVDGVQTDRPDRLARLLTDEYGRPPAAGLSLTTAQAGDVAP
jgi:glycerophosphoryl diester phosphodiesterase